MMLMAAPPQTVQKQNHLIQSLVHFQFAGDPVGKLGRGKNFVKCTKMHYNITMNYQTPIREELVSFQTSSFLFSKSIVDFSKGRARDLNFSGNGLK